MVDIDWNTFEHVKVVEKHFDEKGRLHRLDGPAVVYDNGRTEWKKFGRYHRVGGPAIDTLDGSIQCWYKNGQQHREDGPADIWFGFKKWFFKGNLHREDGPAVEFPDGTIQFWLKGIQYNEDEYFHVLKKYFSNVE